MGGGSIELAIDYGLYSLNTENNGENKLFFDYK